MAGKVQIILFGDLTCDSVAGLRSLARIKDNPLLTSFFERVAAGLRAEIGSLPSLQRDGFVRFTHFAELLSKTQKSTTRPHPAVENALVCAYQLACFINHYSATNQPYPSKDTRLVGLCTGLLAAAAVSCCQTLTELIPLAAHTVLVAFRTGICVSDVRDHVEPCNESPSPWSVLLAGLQGDATLPLLTKFNEDRGLPAASQAYISTYATTSVTISGPPSTLKELLAADYLPKSSSLGIPVYGPYHASHLYGQRDLGDIVKRTAETEFTSYQQHIPVISSVRQKPSGESTYGYLLKASIEEILVQPLRLDRILTSLAGDEEVNSGPACIIRPIATSASASFCAALKKSGLDVTVEPCLSAETVSHEVLSESGHLAHSKLAIIGYSGRYPDAKDNEEFWKIIHEGRDVVSITPSNRWDVKTHVDPTLKRKNTSGTPYGCWLKDPGLFDAKFFNLSPREAPQVDPAQRLALMTTYEAMESAGLVPDTTPSTQSDRVGVFIGSTSNDWGEINSSQDVDTYYIPGSCRAFIPGRQNFFFKFSGPSYSIDTACSSGLAALHLACNALWQGDIDTAICGGTNVLTNPDITAGLDRGHFLSRTGNCKTFDDGADGYCRGEGVCSLVVKRLEDAEADNDPIAGIILGAYTNHSAEAESITRPHAGAQKAIFEKVLTSAAVDPFSVGYIEMHGTGTQAGDAREMESVLSVFAPGTAAPRTDAQRLFLGSAKANVGHGESASGPIALIKALMMMERSEIPPHCGIKTKINSGFPKDLKERNVHIANMPHPWPRPDNGVRRVMVNNFSAAGGNSSVLIEDPPIVQRDATVDPRSVHVVAVSAKSSTALVGNIKSLLAYIADTKPSLASLSYTTTARRSHHPFRVLVSGSEIEEISTKLETKLTAPSIQTRTRPVQPIAFAFTGQGSQYPGMGREFLEFSAFRADIQRFNAMAEGQGYPSFLPLIEESGRDIADFDPLVVQVGTVCIQMALARLWMSWGMTPCAVVGHSLGEYAALNVSGVLSEADTIFVVGKRAQLLQQQVPPNTHAMLAIKADYADIRPLCEGFEYEVSCQNAPMETVLGGTNEEIDAIIQALSSAKFKTTKLQVPFAFHSSQMQPILGEFHRTAQVIKFHDPKVPVLSPLLGEVLTTNDSLGPEYLARHCRETVNLVAAMDAASASGLINNALWVEIGAHPVVSNLLKANLDAKTTTVATLQRNKDPWLTLSSSMTTLYEAGVNIRWSEYHRDFRHNLSVLRLPAYCWDLKEYWMQYMNDWTLYKGDAQFLQNKNFPTTCVHRLIEEKNDGTKMLLVGEADILRDDVDPFVRGHRVNNVPLVTPSVYAEMALVLGEQLRGKYPEFAQSLVDLQGMDVQRPLATKNKGKGPQLLRCRVELEVSTKRAQVEFWSVTPAGQPLVKHAEASMAFPDKAKAHEEARHQAKPILKQMADLNKRLGSDERVQKLTGNTGYQVVASLASYDPPYKGVSAVVLDSANREIAATVKFNNPSMQGIYQVNPYLIDNFGQPAMFVMNANDQADLTKEVFVNHGWRSLHFYKPLSMDKTYRSHAKMSGPHDDGMYSGDMTIFEKDDVVAVFKGIKAQGVPRRLMDYIVHMRDDNNNAGPNQAAVKHNGQGSIPVATGDESPDTWTAALKIISEESGIPIEELHSDAAFDDMGVDSLLSLICASRFREELGLHYEADIFLDYPTVKDLQSFWKKDTPEVKTIGGRDAILNSMISDIPVEYDGVSRESQSTGSSSYDGLSESTDTSVSNSPRLAATSLLLQGNPALATTAKTLFLLPDGSGSCSSYAALPRMHNSVAVVGMNCPFMKIPEQYTCGIEMVSALYVEEIRRRQPQGPYSLGGWSVGGIFAYNAAQRLVSEGEEVTDLVLIDCPVPRGLDHLPRRYFEYCDKIGLLGEVNGVKKDPPKWLIPHFEACVNSLHDYHASAFTPPSAAPKTHIIWASDAIDKNCTPKFDRKPDDPEGLRFLTEARTDYGPCGWETLIPQDKMDFAHISDANHFTMMRGEGAKLLSAVIEKFLVNL
ncbi:type I polyketide synthase [Aspergillus lucknowensis]|uniref:Polyketide synthase n=1 Tax=Aspergillus lucknowensis TaxID=176173 RepID=A0ABR4LDC0_9EURO